MRRWARRSNRYYHNLPTLGDFDIDRAGSDGSGEFTSTGLTVPDELMNLPKTIYDDPGERDDDSFYDQIAWFQSGGEALIDLEVRAGGNFAFQPFVYTGLGLSRRSMGARLSNRFPLWVEFGLRFAVRSQEQNLGSLSEIRDMRLRVNNGPSILAPL